MESIPLLRILVIQLYQYILGEQLRKEAMGIPLLTIRTPELMIIRICFDFES